MEHQWKNQWWRIYVLNIGIWEWRIVARIYVMWRILARTCMWQSTHSHAHSHNENLTFSSPFVLRACPLVWWDRHWAVHLHEFGHKLGAVVVESCALFSLAASCITITQYYGGRTTGPDRWQLFLITYFNLSLPGFQKVNMGGKITKDHKHPVQSLLHHRCRSAGVY